MSALYPSIPAQEGKASYSYNIAVFWSFLKNEKINNHHSGEKTGVPPVLRRDVLQALNSPS
jgi:hypothetical protein